MARNTRTVPAKQPAPSKAAAASKKNRRTPRPAPKLPPSVRARLLLAKLGMSRKSLELTGRALARLAMGVMALALGYAVLSLIQQHLANSPSFAIEHIDITGNQQLTAAQVIDAAGLKIGQNIFKLAPDDVQHRLEQLPWIEYVSVRRRLPGRYSIDLRERRAVALLAAHELYLVSDEGIAFKPLSGSDPADLPVITGVDPNRRTQDAEGVSSALMSAVALMHDYQDAGLARREVISEIHIEGDGGLSLYVGPDATYVRLGKAPFRQKLERFREVLARLAKDKARASYVYLDNQRRVDRVTARLR
jgi:cell division protein FtsQ